MWSPCQIYIPKQWYLPSPPPPPPPLTPTKISWTDNTTAWNVPTPCAKSMLDMYSKTVIQHSQPALADGLEKNKNCRTEQLARFGSSQPYWDKIPRRFCHWSLWWCDVQRLRQHRKIKQETLAPGCFDPLSFSGWHFQGFCEQIFYPVVRTIRGIWGQSQQFRQPPFGLYEPNHAPAMGLSQRIVVQWSLQLRGVLLKIKQAK